MNKFETIDINNSHCEFQYKVEYGDELNPDMVYFKIFSIPENPMRWFSYTFKIIDDTTAKGEMMTNNGFREFAKKGIPEKIIEIASSFLQKNIISSPVNFQAANYLVDSTSKKAWERLVKNNDNASFNKDSDNFELKIIKNKKT